MTHPVCWVLLATHRVGHFLHTLSQYDKQSHPLKRLVIIENGPALGSFPASWGSVTVLRSYEGGLVPSLNVGLDFIKERGSPTDWVCKWDDDDFYGAGYLETVASCPAQACGARAAGLLLSDGRRGTIEHTANKVFGGTLCCRVGVAPRFRPINQHGEDYQFQRDCNELGVEFEALELPYCYSRLGAPEEHSWGCSLAGLLASPAFLVKDERGVTLTHVDMGIVAVDLKRQLQGLRRS